MEEEFIRVYNLYKNDILRLAFSYTKNISEAEDITQSVFIKLFKNLNKFTSDIEIKKWCIKVTVNECKNYFLSSWYKRRKQIDKKEENNLYYLENYDNDLKDALFKLKPKDRILIFLYYYEGYKHKEIASILKMNSSTVQTRLDRIVKSLAKEMKGVYNEK